ncbi:hypothetical protein SAMN05216504_3599 [Pseudomonas sp. A214]|nr:hypothetical protein SAMN05216504_3599 [Pseudomonas sp. A214]
MKIGGEIMLALACRHYMIFPDGIPCRQEYQSFLELISPQVNNTIWSIKVQEVFGVSPWHRLPHLYKRNILIINPRNIGLNQRPNFPTSNWIQELAQVIPLTFR